MGGTKTPGPLTAQMTALPGLTLPSPARELWLKSRDVLTDGLRQIQDGGPEYALGGGTILAARWRHRSSFDVDVLVPPDTPLQRSEDPAATDFVRAIRAIGGEPHYSRELGKLKIGFPNGSQIDFWARTPIFGSATTREHVEGRAEAVLSSAQILRGKIERGDMNVVRDVYDVVTARTCDATALEAAVNAIPRPLAEGLAWSWHHANPVLCEDAATQLRGTNETEPQHRDLGTRAAAAIHAALYETMTIEASPRLIAVEMATGGGIVRRYPMAPTDADREFEERGLNAHLANKGPGADAIREHAKTRAARTAKTVVVYEEERDAATWHEPR